MDYIIPYKTSYTFKFHIRYTNGLENESKYLLSGDFPDNFSIRYKNHSMYPTDFGYLLDPQKTYSIYIDDEYRHKLVPTINTKSVETVIFKLED
jgi:hypothetical protein